MQYPFGEQPEKASVLADERPQPEKHPYTWGSITFTRTRFLNKETVETAYLLDRILGWEPHTHISDGVKAGMLEVAAQGSYEKAGESSCQGEDRVNRNTVMR